MKKLIFLLFILLIFNKSSFSQKNGNSENLKISKSANQLIRTINQLLNNYDVIPCDYSTETTSIKRKYKWGLMQARDYAGVTKTGKLSFLTSIWELYKNDSITDEYFLQNAVKPIRISWYNGKNEVEKDFESLGKDCLRVIPKKVFFPYSQYQHNHSYQILIVPKSIYISKNLKDIQFKIKNGIPYGELAVNALNINSINKIESIYIENVNNHMDINHHKEYISSKSSVGVLCNVFTSNDEKISCYIFSNYPDLLKWKN